MTETSKTRTTIIVPCIECSTLNRVEMEFAVTPAKNIVEEEERKKLESEANNAGKTDLNTTESERVRPDGTPGKPAEGKPDDSASDSADEPGDKQGNTGTDAKSKSENRGTKKGTGKSKGGN